LALDSAVEESIEFLTQANIIKETLLIVTADHSHTLTINGNPPRGNNILGNKLITSSIHQ
jgi:alkaline phosphatase